MKRDRYDVEALLKTSAPGAGALTLMSLTHSEVTYPLLSCPTVTWWNNSAGWRRTCAIACSAPVSGKSLDRRDFVIQANLIFSIQQTASKQSEVLQYWEVGGCNWKIKILVFWILGENNTFTIHTFSPSKSHKSQVKWAMLTFDSIAAFKQEQYPYYIATNVWPKACSKRFHFMMLISLSIILHVEHMISNVRLNSTWEKLLVSIVDCSGPASSFEWGA